MTDDIVAIDAKISGSQNTIRQAIMAIPATTGNTDTPLVFSIDRKWKQTGYNFSFHPDKLDEGRRLVRGLIPILLHSYSEDQLKPFFTPRTFAAGKHLTYDPVTDAVSSTADRDLNSIFDGDDEMASIVPGKEAMDDAPGGQVFGQQLTTALTKERHDDDTISTLHNGDNTRPHTLGALPDAITAHNERSTQAAHSDTRSTGSATTTSSLSITTKHTLNSRMTHMETDVGDIHSQLSEITVLIKALATKQRARIPPPPPPRVTQPQLYPG
jgi:hypothetical protein